jgi:hypothetical protein
LRWSSIVWNSLVKGSGGRCWSTISLLAREPSQEREIDRDVTWFTIGQIWEWDVNLSQFNSIIDSLGDFYHRQCDISEIMIWNIGVKYVDKVSYRNIEDWSGFELRQTLSESVVFSIDVTQLQRWE